MRNYKRLGRMTAFPCSRTTADFKRHYNNEDTLYFTGGREQHILFKFDIDCKQRGTTQGAYQYYQEVLLPMFPNLYFESSTSGVGGHCYAILYVDNYKPQDVVFCLKKLEAKLQADVAKTQSDTTHDFEWIEIKGLPMVADYQDGLKVTLGSLAKVPREMATRFDEFRNTSVVHINSLAALPDIKVEKKTIAAYKAKQGIKGSTGLSFEWERLEQYKKIARPALLAAPCPCTNQTRVTADDAAIFLLLFDAFANKYANKDGSMPYARFASHWQDAYDNDEIDRAFSTHRLTALVHWASSLGWIDWEDNHYTPPTIIDGKKIKGIACKWSTSASLQKLFSLVLSNETTETLPFLINTHTLDVSKNNNPVIKPEMLTRNEIEQREFASMERLVLKFFDPAPPDWSLALAS